MFLLLWFLIYCYISYLLNLFISEIAWCLKLCIHVNILSLIIKWTVYLISADAESFFLPVQLLLQKVENFSYQQEDTARPHAQSTLYQWILAAPQDQAEPTLEK